MVALRRLGRPQKHSIRSIRAEWARRSRRSVACRTHSDFNIRRLEVCFTKKNIGLRLGRAPLTLDVGCGDGVSTAQYAHNAVGIDYNRAMAKLAMERGVQSIVSDARHLPFADRKFDATVSMRTLINLPTWRQQRQVLDEMIRVTRSKGLIVLAETSQQGLHALSRMRVEAGLRPITPPWFNRPVDEKRLLSHLSIRRKLRLVDLQRFNLYFLMTRILHPLLVSPNEPNPKNKINEVAADIALKMPDVKCPTKIGLDMASQMICLAVSRR